MVQPFHTDLFSCTISHWLFDIVTRSVIKERIYPNETMVFWLGTELWLTVNRPTQKPAGIFYRYNTAGDHFTSKWISFTDICDIWNNSLIKCLHSGTHPVAQLTVITEFIRISKVRALGGNTSPHIPSATWLDFRIIWSRCILGSHCRIFHTSTICDEHKIILCEGYEMCFTFRLNFNTGSLLSVGCNIKLNIYNLCIIVEYDTGIFQIFYHRKDHTLILIIFCKAQSGEIRKPSNMVNI